MSVARAADKPDESVSGRTSPPSSDHVLSWSCVGARASVDGAERSGQASRSTPWTRARGHVDRAGGCVVDPK
ncbi:hypothetical protein ONE63_008586 [Megalurothrips usitatus]|uniref:Uncharacterized protein n=1 Tax=Megalurothrips usitatus TaxID=439358 RepID=A0AAV7XQU1_9NEOP|nr:hypothetical protein ONE63_008586 [Megalurothrips usitatus]